MLQKVAITTSNAAKQHPYRYSNEGLVHPTDTIVPRVRNVNAKNDYRYGRYPETEPLRHITKL